MFTNLLTEIVGPDLSSLNMSQISIVEKFDSDKFTNLENYNWVIYFGFLRNTYRLNMS